jgi:hypothetical protein
MEKFFNVKTRILLCACLYYEAPPDSFQEMHTEHDNKQSFLH